MRIGLWLGSIVQNQRRAETGTVTSEMGDKLRFDGKVAVITGAGGGLGREYALALGARGAKVIVNDLGGDIKGGGKSSAAADKVVEEIRAAGGEAFANYDSVEDGEKVIQTALDKFGKIDIVINNAGILRDRSFARTSDLDWDLIHRVHLRGSFMVTRAAWEVMKKQKFGRVIMTASAAGIYGNFGQANYSSAKLGLVGLSHTLAREGEKYNIHSNAIAPIAGSRMTETVMPKDMVDMLKPAYVAPLVLWLCHEDCEESGSLFETGAGWIGKLRWQRTEGVALRMGDNLTPEGVRDHFGDITDFSKATYPTSTVESNMHVHAALQNVEAVKPQNTSGISFHDTAGGIHPDQAVGAKLKEASFTYTERDTILYNIGVGVSTKNDNHLKFLFEMNEEFSLLPTYAVIPAMGVSMGMGMGGIPGLEINPTMILHGEQYLEIFKPLQTEGTIKSTGYIADILDKGKGAVIIVNVESFNEAGEKVAFNQVTTFVQKAGGFGGRRTSDKAIEPANPPKRAPDASVKQAISVDQAAVYRLSGDRNPLHIDPSFAAMGGFSQPILHGLCSFGYAARHVLETYADNDVTKFKAIKVRFSRPVLPGQTTQTDMWKEGNRIFFTSKVVETGEVSLSGAYVDLFPGAGDSAAAAAAGPGLMSDVIFNEISRRLGENPALAKKVNAVISWNITKDGKKVTSWTGDMKGGNHELYNGEPRNGKADCTMTISDQDMIDLSTRKLNGQQAFLQGKLKISGNIMLSQKLADLMQDKPKL